MARFDPILFDLDGTLVDSGRDIAESVNITFEKLGLPPLEHDRVVAAVGDGVRKLVQRCLEQVGRSKDEDEVVRLFRSIYRERALVNTRPYPGMEDLLRRLQGSRLAVVTNKPGDFARQVLDGLGLSRYFAAVVGGDEVPRPKPDPAHPLRACELLGGGPAGGIMIGDYSNDVEAGRAAGMATCGVLWGFAGSDAVLAAGPDYTCPTPRDLERLLLGES
ncbi:MAG: HAD family hydrolase [Deltaproteobacteria bacterium]|nr:MAG: HAD family hydrolase [Deltaproteobacteria bacterium]